MPGSNGYSFFVQATRTALGFVGVIGLLACAQIDAQAPKHRSSDEKHLSRVKAAPLFGLVAEDFFEGGGAVNGFKTVGPSELDQALLAAARVGDTEAMRQQLKAGALVDSVDGSGNTPLTYVAASGDLVRARLLLKEGADVEGRGGILTPLASAALRGHGQMVRLLLRRGANPDAQGQSGVAPLVLAVRLNNLAIADALLSAGARTDALERDGASLLMMTITRNQAEMADLLLRYGADPNSGDAKGVKVLTWARQLKRDKIEQSLLQAGARDKDLAISHGLSLSMRKT